MTGPVRETSVKEGVQRGRISRKTTSGEEDQISKKRKLSLYMGVEFGGEGQGSLRGE